MTNTGQGLVVPEDILAKFPELVELVKGSESMNNEERQYWINIMPIMTPEQLTNLRDILLNEKRQLAAIDQKYAKEIEQIGHTQLIQKTHQERKRRRTKLHEAEEESSMQENALEEDILRRIEEF